MEVESEYRGECFGAQNGKNRRLQPYSLSYVIGPKVQVINKVQSNWKDNDACGVDPQLYQAGRQEVVALLFSDTSLVLFPAKISKSQPIHFRIYLECLLQGSAIGLIFNSYLRRFRLISKLILALKLSPVQFILISRCNRYIFHLFKNIYTNGFPASHFGSQIPFASFARS